MRKGEKRFERKRKKLKKVSKSVLFKHFRRSNMADLWAFYAQIQQLTPSEYASYYYHDRPLLREQMALERRLKKEAYLEEICPENQRKKLPLLSERYYSDEGRGLFVPYADILSERYQYPLIIQCATIVNERKCYYTKYTLKCPRCSKRLDFVDVTTIRFLEEDDVEEKDEFSFLELSPVAICSKCGYIWNFYDKRIEDTVSYKLIQKIKEERTQREVRIEKRSSAERKMPDGVQRSIKFVKSKVMLGVRGYSYLVNTYECCHCHKQYDVCEINSIRKEPYFIPKELRAQYLEDFQQNKSVSEYMKTTRVHMQLKKKDKEQSLFPREQWVLPPYCLECGYYLYPYDLYEDEPIPTTIGVCQEKFSINV